MADVCKRLAPKAQPNLILLSFSQQPGIPACASMPSSLVQLACTAVRWYSFNLQSAPHISQGTANLTTSAVTNVYTCHAGWWS